MTVSAMLGGRCRGARRAPGAPGLALDVHGDDGPLAEVRHRLNGQVVDERAVHEAGLPRTCGGATIGRHILSPTASQSGPERRTSRRPLRSARRRRTDSRAAAPRSRGRRRSMQHRLEALAADARVARQRVVPGAGGAGRIPRSSVSSISSASSPIANSAPMTAPMLTPATRSTTMPASASSSSTPSARARGRRRLKGPDRPTDRQVRRRAMRARSLSSSLGRM